jgi:hypothetical protein
MNAGRHVDEQPGRGPAIPGITSVREIAAELNARGILTPRGGAWHPTSTARAAGAIADVSAAFAQWVPFSRPDGQQDPTGGVSKKPSKPKRMLGTATQRPHSARYAISAV